MQAGIRDAEFDDAGAISEIANALLSSTAIEWTDTPHTPEERSRWLAAQQAAGFPVLVATRGTSVVGWAGYGDFRDTARWPGYRFTAELTIHVRQAAWGGGVGAALMHALVERARQAGKHVLVAGVDGGNERSLRFHARMGFREVARMPQVGAKLGRWLDLVLLQRILDDRPVPPA